MNPNDNENHSHLDNVQADTMPDALKGNDISMEDLSTDKALIPDNVDIKETYGEYGRVLSNGRIIHQMICFCQATIRLEAIVSMLSNASPN